MTYCPDCDDCRETRRADMFFGDPFLRNLINVGPQLRRGMVEGC